MAEAISTRKETFHAIVSDIGLPDGDGLELMERLTKIQKVRGIVLSGYGMGHDLARSHPAGFVEHLTKPVDWPQLASALLRLMKGIGASTTLRLHNAPSESD